MRNRAQLPVRIPGTRGHSRYLTPRDISAIQAVLELHDPAARCGPPDCPVTWLSAFLDQLARDLTRRGPAARAQLWASLFTVPLQEETPQ